MRSAQVTPVKNEPAEDQHLRSAIALSYTKANLSGVSAMVRVDENPPAVGEIIVKAILKSATPVP